MNKPRSIAKHIIFGLGKSGIACAGYFDRINKPYSLIDSRENVDLECLKSLSCCQSTFFGELDNSLVEGCEQLVLSPGISLNHPLVQRAQQLKIDVCGDVELFARECHKPIVAITGSNGKSTVTDLIAKVMSLNGLDCQKGGNIGLPVLDFLPLQQADIYVLELSSFQLDSTESLRPSVAILLNISEDHMDRYLDFDDYIYSKKKIYNKAKHRIFNWQDKNTHPLEISALDMAFTRQKLSSKKIQNQAYLRPNEQSFDLCINDKKVVNSKQLNITGIHNMMNVLACLATLECLDMKLSQQAMDGLKKYQGLAHRFQLVSRYLDCEWIDDSKATNVGATLAAIKSLDLSGNKQLILIAGGDSKQSDLSPLKQPFNSRVSHLILMGVDAKKLAAVVPSKQPIFANDMKAAVQKAADLCEPGDVVLLSPACSSLDMYSNFEARGLDFQKAVRECA